jgi:hypothetical protein
MRLATDMPTDCAGCLYAGACPINAEVKRLQKEIDNLKANITTVRGEVEDHKKHLLAWLRGYGPGGWIDNLRKDNESLRALCRRVNADMTAEQFIDWMNEIADAGRGEVEK